ncbi:MAG: glycosyltransferase family 2 protein [Cohnella sp.]|nr:glycosyltransferase family 2 protein [Cohnella sp.]
MLSASLKVCIIIPAYNEEKSIFHVIRNILRLHPDFTVLVINDGSSDRTEMVAKSAGADVVTLSQNLGIGGAVQTGYRYAAARDFDVAVQVDADGQHKPEELDKILEPIRQDKADMVIGSRFVEQTSYQSSAGRRTGILILSSLVTLFARQPLKDVTSGFRAINRRVIRMFAEDYSTDYPEVDSLIMVKKKHFRIQEIAVEMEQRQSGSSSITSFKSVYYMVKVTLSIMMKSFR